MSKQVLFGDGVYQFEMYRMLESLTDYLLVAQDEPLVEHFGMSDGRWARSEHKGLVAVVTIASIDCTLAPTGIDDKIDFDADWPALRLIKAPAAGYDDRPVGVQLDFAAL